MLSPQLFIRRRHCARVRRLSLDRLHRQQRDLLYCRLQLEPLEERRLLSVNVVTDLPDYYPGATAHIFASGYQVGEAVQFQVLHTDGTPNTGGGHEPWVVADGGFDDLDGAVDGNVHTTWYVDPDDSLNSIFELTAVGLSSNEVAVTTFTDADVPKVKLSGFENEAPTAYVSGNLNNAAYVEGNSVPFRYFAADAEEGSQLILFLNYQFKKVTGSDTDNTFDFLTSDNASQSLTDGVRFGPNDNTKPSGFGLTSPAPNPVTVAIPDDPTITLDVGVRNFIFTSNVPFVVTPTATFVGATGDEKQIKLILRMGNDGDGTASEKIGDFGIFFGTHLARDADYPSANDGAADAPGSSYKISVEGFNDENFDGIQQSGEKKIGQEQANMDAGAVVSPSLEWEKRRGDTGTLQGGATFSVSPNPLTGAGTLTVVDNGTNDADPDLGQIRLQDVLFATYTVTETIAPAGFALDDDVDRVQTVSISNLNAAIGTQDSNDTGNSDESDFYDELLDLASIAWEKRDHLNNLQGGATFTITPDPLTGSSTPLTVVDNGANDANPVAGQLLVNNVLLGSYTVTETVAPSGYALDDDPTRSVTVDSADLAAVIGTQGSDDEGNTDESDFHNRLGSISWEKRDHLNNLQGGATFTITANPLTGSGTLTVVDGGANDADPNAGQILVNNVLLGSYTVTETVAPSGYALDDDPNRAVTVSSTDLAAMIGTQGSDDEGNSDESDFHNRLGSIAWEKRDHENNLQGGATFTITPNPLTGSDTLTVVDNGANDANPVAGQILVSNVLLGSYTVTETVAPSGYALDDDPTRSVTLDSTDLAAVIGTQGSDDEGNSDESDFHNRLASIAWEKRDHLNNLQGGATFTITPNPLTGSGTLTVVDNGTGDDDPVAGQLLVNNVLLGSYTVTETVAPSGYALDDDPTRSVTVGSTDLAAVIGTQGSDDEGNTNESDFHNRLGSIAWEKRDHNAALQGGATFSITANPLTGSGTLTVVDNGGNDANPVAGQLLVNNVLLGSYTVTETVAPSGFALDDDPDRVVTVSDIELNAVIGTQNSDDAGDSDESDFHNRLASIAWEKRDHLDNLQGGATFTITPNPLTASGTLTVVDNGTGDDDPVAGQLLVNNVLLGTYTVTETIPPSGYALDDDPDRAVTVSDTDLAAVIGTQGSDDEGNTNESDFHNRLGSIAWEKRDHNAALQGGATFSITANPLTGSGTLTVVDNGTNDANPVAGQLLVNNVLLGSYTVTETVAPSGYELDDDPERTATVSDTNLAAVIGTQGSDDPGDTDESDFHNELLSPAPSNGFAVRAGQSGTSGGDEGRSIAVDAQGNSYVSGTFYFADGPSTGTTPSIANIFVAKYSPDGSLLWQHLIGSTADDRGRSIAVDSSSNVYVTGAFQGTVDFNPSSGVKTLKSSGNFDIFVLKLDTNGVYQWAQKYGASGLDFGEDIAVDAANNILVTGQFSSKVDFDPSAVTLNLTSAGNTDAFVLKLAPNGTTIWAKRVGGSSVDRGSGIATDTSNNVYVTGAFSGTADFNPGTGTTNLASAGQTDVFILRLTATGDYSLAKRVGGSSADEGLDVDVDASGSIYTTGYFRASADFDPGSGVRTLTSTSGADVFIWKLAANGALSFAERVGGADDDYGRGVVVLPDGSIGVVGDFELTVDFDPRGGTANLVSRGKHDGFVLHLSQSGDYLSARQIGGGLLSTGRGIATDAAGALYATGFFTGNVRFDFDGGFTYLDSGGGRDVYVTKLGSFAGGPSPSPGSLSVQFVQSVVVDARQANAVAEGGPPTVQALHLENRDERAHEMSPATRAPQFPAATVNLNTRRDTSAPNGVGGEDVFADVVLSSSWNTSLLADHVGKQLSVTALVAPSAMIRPTISSRATTALRSQAAAVAYASLGSASVQNGSLPKRQAWASTAGSVEDYLIDLLAVDLTRRAQFRSAPPNDSHA